MTTEKVFFGNPEGKMLAARLDRPANTPVAWAIFAHCFTCSKNVSAVANIARALVSEGYGVLRFDFTGLGDSEGEFGETNFSSNVSDVVAAATFLREHHGEAGVLIGHSLGGTAVLHAARLIPGVRAVASIAAPFDPAHVKRLVGPQVQAIEEKGHAEVSLAGQSFMLTKQFLDDISSHDANEVVRSFHGAVLVVHSPIDRTVDVSNAANIFAAARHPKSFVSLDTADHMLTDRADSTYAGKVIAAWARKYIPRETQTTTVEVEGEHLARVSIGRDRFLTDLLSGPHAYLADEPKSQGGEDRGPTPFQYLVGSLGACTAITLRMYADRKQWPLEAVTVDVEHRRVSGDDLEVDVDPRHHIELFEQVVSLEGELGADQRKRLSSIARKCPIHRVLDGRIVIRTEVD